MIKIFNKLKKYLLTNWIWLGKVVSVVAAAAAVLALPLGLLTSDKPSSAVKTDSYINIGNGDVGQIAQASDGGVAITNARDPLDRETISLLLSKMGARYSVANDNTEYAYLNEKQVIDAVLKLEFISIECTGSRKTAVDAKNSLVRGDTNQAETLYKIYINDNCTGTKNSPSELVEAYRGLALITYKHDQNASLKYLSKAIEIYPYDPVDLLNIGNLYRQSEKYEKAQNSFERVIKIVENEDNLSILLRALANEGLGQILNDLGEYDRAIEKFVQAISGHSSIYNSKGASRVLETVARTYLNQKLYGKSFDTVRQMLTLEKTYMSDEDIVSRHIAIGLMYTDEGQTDKLYAILDDARSLNRTLEETPSAADNYASLANAYLRKRSLKMQDVSLAIELFEKSRKINKTYGRDDEIAKASGMLGTLYKTRGDIDKATARWQESLAIYKEIDTKMAVEVMKYLDSLN